MAAVIQNPLKALGDQFYKEAIEHCRSYNARLCAERSVRLPFLDSQTGVAQNNCYIWMERHHRGPDRGLSAKDSLPSQGTTLEALLRGEGLDKRGRDEESLLEIQRVLEADAQEDGYHNDEDFEVDTQRRKHRGKGRGRGSGRRRTDANSTDDQDKPYICDNRYKQKHNSKTAASVCGKRYRNRTGLSYHYSHAHLAEEEGPGEKDSEPSQSPPTLQPNSRKHPKGHEEAFIPNNNYCNVCLGKPGSNRKMGKSGDLARCTKCGRSARGTGQKEDRNFVGAEELFGTTSESDTSTFHGFEEDEFEDPSSNSSETSTQCR
ncbi:zinc finger protein DPF3 isoform X3 [Denticeps clupeoides]|uniref:zinc finger protein DPF3 isoform X3 n=1 Tax=Denticeps clupeoides TaxID=299321 RepID=UPI0010A4B5B9|nr:zinc finger protein DPF3-like isoform X3 [Denticeps clupeoides]